MPIVGVVYSDASIQTNTSFSDITLLLATTVSARVGICLSLYIHLPVFLSNNFAVFEALFTSQFNGDDTPIVASTGSLFYTFLGCSGDTECVGTASQCTFSHFGLQISSI